MNARLDDVGRTRVLRAGDRADARASARSVWRVVGTLGGETGYLYADWLWRLRGLIDRAVGGPGLGTDARTAGGPRVGDRFDCWTVVAVEPGRRLALGLDMRAPGRGVLDFAIEPLATVDGQPRARVVVTATWRPRGAWGLAYWYVMAPGHRYVYRGLCEAIARRAEALEAGGA